MGLISPDNVDTKSTPRLDTFFDALSEVSA